MREQSHRLRPGGLTLQICRWGQAQHRPLVILHGFLEQGAAWDAVATQLSGRSIWAPDQRGHGRSEHVGTGGFYHFWDYVSDLDALIQSIGQPVDLVGHSMGGTVASLYAGSMPDQVRRLVLIEGLGPPDGTTDVVRRARIFLHHHRQGLKHNTMDSVQAAGARMQRHNPNLDDTLVQQLAQRVTTPSGDGVTWTWDRMHRYRSPTPFSHAQFLCFLEQITAPTLIVDGAESGFVFDEQGQRRQALANAERVIIPGAGHLIHHDAPVALARVIQAHIDKE